MTYFWITLGALIVSTALIKGAGPVLLGGRELPARFNGVISLMAPALLTALVVTSTFADGDHWEVGAMTIGVLVAAIAAWRGTSALWTVAIAVILTAALRLAGMP